jgi:hypothetical protein
MMTCILVIAQSQRKLLGMSGHTIDSGYVDDVGLNTIIEFISERLVAVMDNQGHRGSRTIVHKVRYIAYF